MLPVVRERFSDFARSLSSFVSTPIATALAFALILVWALSGPYFRFSDAWALLVNTATSIVTFLMVFVLNNAQSRDTSAINAKLDAVILAIESADNRMIGLERQTELTAREIHQDVIAVVDAVSYRRRRTAAELDLLESVQALV
jgi:low affinity Fe/Cu permease